jgi:two-component system CheB/CheR fusion protein
LRILLVEDNKDTLRAAAWYLELLKYEVRTAADLATARQLVASEPFDLLLSDIELPDGSGLDLMRELRGSREIVGIAMSGFGSEEDVQASQRAGFVRHLVKPVSSRTLHETIQQVSSGPGRDEPAGEPGLLESSRH